MKFVGLLICVAVCYSMLTLTEAAVISIDFGSEWIKVALVKPGVPMEIVINKESKRKTAAVVSLRNNERLFGEAALNTAVKYPKNAYRYLQLLVGQKYNSPLVQLYKRWFPWYDIKPDEERGTVLFQHDEKTVFSPEELIAMILDNCRLFAEAFVDDQVTTIHDVIITVPAFFNQAQRNAILQSAKLVGLNVLQLMNDNAAAALNYGVFRQSSFNTTTQHVMFYDMGSLSTTATVVEYQRVQVKEGSVANMYPQLTVKGTGYDRTLGGMEMEIRLRDHLAKIFESQKKTKQSVYDSPRAMSKLLKEAKRVKQVLSANAVHTAQIEGLLQDVDFKVSISRTELEDLCTDLFERVESPITQALEAADMIMDEIDTVILVGGGTRVPKVQETLLKVVNKRDLGKSLNTDEAIALGAVYQGAAYSKLFRVGKFIVKQGTLFPVQVAFSRTSTAEGKEGEEAKEFTKVVKRTLFHRSNSYPQKKVLTFNRYSDDFSFQVFYGDLDFLSEEERRCLGRLNISEVYLAGVGEAVERNQQGESKGIKAHFHMDDSGLLNLDNVECVFEYPGDVQPDDESTLSKLSNAFTSFFGGGTDSDSVSTEDTVEEVPTETSEFPSTDSTEPPSDRSSRTQTTDELPNSDESEASEGPEESTGSNESLPERETDESVESEEPTGSNENLSEGEIDESDDESIESEEPTGSNENLSEGEIDESDDESIESEEPTGSNEGFPEDENKESEELTASKDGLSKGDNDENEGDGREPVQARGEQPDTESEENPTGSNEDSDSESTDTADSPSPANVISDASDKSSKSTKKKSKTKKPQENLVKVNLTAEITVLDLTPQSESSERMSIEKLQALQQRDDDKLANEKAKNSLESHIFETTDAMTSDSVIMVSTEEQRETILSVLSEAAEWLEDEGYIAKTKIYKDKLRELKKASRALFRRVEEIAKRPKYLEAIKDTLNISQDFHMRMRNLTDDLQIFSEVEMTTLGTLIQETEEWISKTLKEQEATPLYEDPVLLSQDIEEHVKRLNREVLYLLNKLKSHPPPKPRTPTNPNSTSNTTEQNTVEKTTEETQEEATTEEKVDETKEQETLQLPPAAAEGDTEEPSIIAPEGDTEEPSTIDDPTVDSTTSDEMKHKEL